MSVLKVGAIQPNSGTKVNITGSTLLVTTASGHFSGSYEGDGSRLEGVAGFPFTGSGQISGSLLVTGSSTLALRVTGSSALTGSLLQSGSTHITGSNVISGSLLVTGSTNPAFRVSGSSALTGSLFVSGAVSSSVGFSGSFQGNGSDLTGVGGFPHTGSADITGSLLVSGAAFVTSLTETSALRYKKWVKDLPEQSDAIFKLRPVHFRWKDNNQKDVGLIAEEVQKVYPELVSVEDDGQAGGIKYTKLTAILVKTIQDLTARIEKLENNKK